MTITSITGDLTGTVSDLEFVHVGSGSDGGPADSAIDSCTSAIASASFDGPIQPNGSADVANAPKAYTVHVRRR